MSMHVKEPSTRSNGSNDMSSKYALTYQELNALLTEIEDPNFTTNIIKLFTDPMENLLSLVVFPFDVKNLSPAWTAQVDSSILINIFQTTTAQGTFLNPVTVPMLNVGNFEIPRPTSSFMDFKPYTTLELYLPYIGFVELDNDEVMGEEISINYAVDLTTGKCTAFVSLYDPTEAEDTRVLLMRDGQCGIRIPIAGGSGAEISKAILSFGIGASVGAVSLGLGAIGAGAGTNASGIPTGGTVGSVTGTLASTTGYLSHTTINAIQAGQYRVHKGGVIEVNNAFYAPQTPFLIYKYPKVTRPSNYDATVGRPLAETRTLSQLTGYTLIEQVHIEGSDFGIATLEEKNMLETQLKNGIIL